MYKREIIAEWDFRTADTKEFTHCYHSYPAMMIPQIARKLMLDFAPKGELDLLLDPYMGSGTSLVEASIMGINSIGTDLNPLARFMSRVKTTHYDLEVIKSCFSELKDKIKNYSEDKVIDKNFDRITNYTFWYNEKSLHELSYLTQIINEISEEYREFFRLVLSEVVREVSFTRNGEFKRYKMNEEKLKLFNPQTFSLFTHKTSRNIKGLANYNSIRKDVIVKICKFNSSIEIPKDIIKENSVDMVVTSPPYGDSKTTVAYGQFSRWANEWFDAENAKNLDSILMGGKLCKEETFETKSIQKELDQIKEIDIKRYFEVISFLNDYNDSIRNVAKVIRKGGRVCYVVGNRNVKGVQIPLDYFTAEMFEKNGFKHEITIVREIPNKKMPSKTSPTNVSGVNVNTMTNEFIVIMTKN